MGNLKNMPKLRFPEFKGNWDESKLGDVADVIMGQSPDGDTYNTTGIGMPLINGPVEFTEKFPVKIKWTSKPTKVCQDKDILFCVRGSTTGRMNIANDKYCIGRGVAAIRANSLSTPSFIELILIKNLGKILNYTTGSTFQNIDSKSLKEYISKFPSLPEQQKIATFLTSVDEKLQALKKKENLLETYKKGVMQKVFSQEYRFTDEKGEAFPDWEMKTLGEIAEIKKGEQLNKDELTDYGTYPCVNGGINPSGYTDLFNSDENTITISEGGNSCGYINYLTTKFWSGGHCYTLKVNNEKSTNNEFLFQLLKKYEIEIKRLRVGSGLPNIQKKDLLIFKFSFPSSIKEQTKIANFLSSIDQKISLTQVEIKKMEAWKKGLLQKMFV